MALAEAFTGAVLIARAFEAMLVTDGGWRALGPAPVRAITAVERDGVPLSPDAHAIDIDGDGVGWVRTAGVPGRVLVRLHAGLAPDWAGLPAPIRQGVVMLAAHLWNAGHAAPPAAVTALWRPWRRMRLEGKP